MGLTRIVAAVLVLGIHGTMTYIFHCTLDGGCNFAKSAPEDYSLGFKWKNGEPWDCRPMLIAVGVVGLLKFILWLAERWNDRRYKEMIEAERQYREARAQRKA